MARKWRPTLSMIVSAMVAVALVLPLSGIMFFRLFENHLIRNTETELIAQSSAIAAAMGIWLQTEVDEGLPLGAEAAVPDSTSRSGSLWSPTMARLSLDDAAILPPRPDALSATGDPDPAYRAAGDFLTPIILQTQQATLAGFRVLDFNGTVIAGRGETGQSLAHVPEVATALRGVYDSALRRREVDSPKPLYSISRGTRVRIFAAMPVIVGDRVAGVVYASRTPSNIVKEMYYLRGKLLMLTILVAAATTLMVLIFARAISGPVQRLADRAARIGKGDRSAIGPLPHYGSREVHRLADELMSMSERLFERSDYISTFATHVSHELKSPLTSIRGAVELLGDDSMSDDQRRRFLENIAEDTERGVLLLDRLRSLARAENAEIAGGRSRLSALMQDARARFPALQIDLVGDAELPVSSDNMKIVLDNLLDNAGRHGATRVTLTPQRQEGGTVITVQDDGEGILADNAAQVFTLFFTTRRQSGGTGLGLAIVSSILRAHKGGISLVPSPQGACFRISLPA